MSNDEENKIYQLLAAHNSEVSSKLNRILGGIAVGVVMGSVIFWGMDASIKENRGNIEYGRRSQNENTKKIAVIESKVVQLEKITYKDSK